MDKPLYTMAEAAKLLCIDRNRIYKLYAAGRIKCLKLGSLKVRAEELERFLRDNEGMDLSDPYNVKPLSEDSSSRIEKAPR